MGKGDKKTKRGKIILGSHGVTRSRRDRPTTVKHEVVKEIAEVPKPKPKARAAKKVKEE